MRAASIFALLAVGCRGDDPCDEEDAFCDCIASRKLADGTCCPAFTQPDADICIARSWTTPGRTDAWGDPGASEVELAVDSEGRGVASFIATDTGRVVIAEERADGKWTLHEPGLALAGVGARPSIAAGADGEAMLAWQQVLVDPPDLASPNDVAYVIRRLADGTWSDADALSFPPSGDDPRPVVAAWGEALVVWNQWTTDGYGVALARRPTDDRDAVLTRADDVLSPPGASSNAPQIVVGANGDALIVWSQAPTRGDDLMIFASERYRVDGEFNRPEVEAFISPTGAAARDPVPALGDLGHAAVVWEQGAGAIFLATRDGLRTWTVPHDLADAFSSTVGGASDATVVFGRDTELFVVWAQTVDAQRRVFAAHRNTLGEWDEPGRDPTLVSSEGHHAMSPALASGPDGEAIVAWAEITDGSRWRIVARRRNAGATRWSELDVLSPNDGTDALHPAVAIGPDGRVVVAWQQGDPGRERIRFASMD